jgi:hypothetical protein
VYTIVETSSFSKVWDKYWTEDEYGDFCGWLARNPYAGVLMKETFGCRKIRWGINGRGKRGGARIIYVNHLDDGRIFLMTMYSKNVTSDVERKALRKLIRENFDE